ncbi:MAG: TRAP transporter large permease subunit [Pseudomonadota bacterium]
MAFHLPFDLILVVLAFAALLAGVPVAVALGGTAVVVGALGSVFGVFDPVLLYAIPARLFGVATGNLLTAVPLFVLMGLALEKSGLVADMIKAVTGATGGQASRSGLTGGSRLPIAVVGVGVLLAASTGIVGASVVMLGLLTLGPMIEQGVPPHRAAGIVAATGTMGQIVPPSVVLIVLGDQLSNAYRTMQLDAGVFAPDTVSVSDLFAGGLLPGLLIAACFITHLVWVGRRERSLTPVDVCDRDTSPSTVSKSFAWNTLGIRFVPLAAPLILIVCVLGSILIGFATPTEAASVGLIATLVLVTLRSEAQRPRPVPWALLVVAIASAALSMILGAASVLATAFFICSGCALLALVILSVQRLVRAKQFAPVLMEAAHLTAMIFFIVFAASVFALVFRGFGGDARLTAFFEVLPGGTNGALFFVMVAIFLLGFFLEFLEICTLVVPLVAPVLLALPMADGSPMNPVWLGILIALNLQTSFLTPPFGVSLFYLRSVVPEGMSDWTIYRGVAPFIALQLLVLVAVFFVPPLATALPNWLFQG